MEADEIIDVTNKEVIEYLEKLQNILIRKIIYQSHSNGFVSLIALKIILSIILCLKKYKRCLIEDIYQEKAVSISSFVFKSLINYVTQGTRLNCAKNESREKERTNCLMQAYYRFNK